MIHLKMIYSIHHGKNILFSTFEENPYVSQKYESNGMLFPVSISSVPFYFTLSVILQHLIFLISCYFYTFSC